MGDRAGPIDRVEIELFVVDDVGDHPSLADHVRHGYQFVRDHPIEVRAAAGPRLGPGPTATDGRRGGDCDIVRSIRVDPWTASEIAGSGAFRRDEHRYLTFVDADPGDDRALSWRVVVASPRLRSVPATLHLRATPSMVLSVLELVPRRRLRWRRDAFVAAGVEAVESLAREFEHDGQVVSDAT